MVPAFLLLLFHIFVYYIFHYIERLLRNLFIWGSTLLKIKANTILLSQGKLSHCMLWRHRGERRYSSYSYLTSALDGVSGQRFTPGTHWTGGWVGPRASLDAESRRRILCPCRGSKSGRPVRSQSLYWLSWFLIEYCFWRTICFPHFLWEIMNYYLCCLWSDMSSPTTPR
jgi:hypothetical protein